MISLTRLSGTVFMLNPDLIERIDKTPDTVITLVDGKKYVVAESVDEVIAEVVRFRGRVRAERAACLEQSRRQSVPPGPRKAEPVPLRAVGDAAVVSSR